MSSSNTDRFDQRLKNALDNIEEAYDAHTWDALQKRLDGLTAKPDSNVPTPAIDELAYRSLADLEVPYEPLHWQQLAAQLDRQQLRKRLIGTKVAEAALFLLLLLNVDAFTNYVPTLFKTTPRHTPVQLPTDEPIANTHKSSGRHALAAHAPKAATDAQPSATNHETFFTESAFGNDLPASKTLWNTSLPLETVAATLLDATTGTTALPNGQMTAQETTLTSAYLPIKPLADWEVRTSMPLALHMDALANTPTLKKRTETYAGIYVARNQYRIQGKQVIVGNARGAVNDVRNAAGWQVGFVGGARRGKWGVETGAAYTRLRYEPAAQPKVVAQYDQGHYTATPTQIEATLLTVPVRGLRQVGKWGRTTAYATIGSTLNLAARKHHIYNVQWQNTALTPDPSPQSIPLPPAATTYAARGILQKGGNLTGNVGATLDTGLRIEHKINRHLTAFAEPAYRHALSNNPAAVEPTRIHTVSIQAGVLATL